MKLLPALDLRNGRVVRLAQGDDRRRTFYDSSPEEVLASYSAAGVERAHVVDLDAALGDGDQRDLLAELVARADAPELQLGGGLRDRDAVEWALGAGFAAIVVTSLMVRDFDLFAALARSHPGRMIAALDLHRGELKTAGWQETAAVDLEELCRRLRDLELGGVLVTDISRDGMLDGPNLGLACEMSRRTGTPAILSGGVSSLDDLRQAAQRREIAAAVVGKALYDGRIEIGAALEACRVSQSDDGGGALEAQGVSS